MIEGKPGRLVEMRKADILVPHEYQRHLSESRAQRIARNFNWYLFGTLTLSHRNGEYYCLDGMHRHKGAMMNPDVDLLPCMLYDFDGPQHEAEIFTLLQMLRKPLVTKDLHRAELFAAGEFGHTARQAQAFIDTLECEAVPLSTIRTLWRRKPDAFERVASLVPELVGAFTLRKDFIEALVYLEDVLGPGDSLAGPHRRRLIDLGYDQLVTSMLAFEHSLDDGRIGKIASPRMKAEALRHAIFGSVTRELATA